MIRGHLIKRAQQLAGERAPFVIATVVRARRPTSVRAGDSAVVLEDGTIEGFVGGDCATSSVRLHSRKALETGEPVLLRLVPGDGEDLHETDAVHGAVIVERNPCLSGGALEIFLEPQLPAARVVVVGDAPIARALADIARAAGYDVVVADAEQAEPGSGDAAGRG
jgi:xanthine dehydrogenase accessory factor